MHRSRNGRTERGFLKLSAFPSHTIVAANQSLRGAGAQTDHDCGTNLRDFSLEPWTAGGDFLGVGPLVNSPLPALGRIEMFDEVGDIYLVARDSSGEQGLVEQFSSWADEWMTGQVFLITRLFADEHHLGTRVSFAEHGLRSATPNVAGATGLSGFCERFD
jgi:hypothetical protein